MSTLNTMVRRAKRGDAEAFITLVEECKMTLRRVALGYLKMRKMSRTRYRIRFLTRMSTSEA